MNLPIPHCGPTHSFVAAGFAGLLTAVVAIYLASAGLGGEGDIILESWMVAYIAAAGFGFGIGVLGVICHLLGDVLTPMGIRPWWPYSKREYSLSLVFAADKQANQALSFSGALAVAAALVAATL